MSKTTSILLVIWVQRGEKNGWQVNITIITPKIKKKIQQKMKMILRDTMLQIKSEELMKLEKKQGGDGGGGGCDVDDVRKEE